MSLIDNPRGISSRRTTAESQQQQYLCDNQSRRHQQPPRCPTRSSCTIAASNLESSRRRKFSFCSTFNFVIRCELHASQNGNEEGSRYIFTSFIAAIWSPPNQSRRHSSSADLLPRESVQPGCGAEQQVNKGTNSVSIQRFHK